MFSLIPFSRDEETNKLAQYFNEVVKNIFGDNLISMVTDKTAFKEDITEVEDRYIMNLTLNGCNKEDIAIKFDQGYLTVIAKQHYKLNVSSSNFMKQDIRYGEVRRKFYFHEVDEKKTEVYYKDDTLLIILPKREK